MGFKIKSGELSKLSKSLQKKIKIQLKKDKILEDFTKDFVNIIRDGKDPSTGGAIDPIGSKWSDRRDRLATKNPTGKGYQSGKSNLTFTGRFLESIKGVIKIKSAGFKLEIKPTGIHRRYTGVKGKPIGKAVKNEVIAQGQKDQGRDVFNISDKLVKKLVQKINKALRRALK